MDQAIIIFLIESYFEIKDLFFKEKSNEKRISFLKFKTKLFYDNFFDENVMIADDKAKEHLEKNYSIFIKYKDTSFIFPHMFVKNIILEQSHKIDPLKDLENYFLFVKNNPNITLHLFLSTIFFHLQRIRFKPSTLEIEVLKLLTNNDFMYYFEDETGKRLFRTYPPTYIEIHRALEKKGIVRSPRSVQKIKTDLFNHQVCYDRRTIVNYAKIGFVYAFLENISEIPIDLENYCLWEIQNGTNKDIIICVPFGNVDEILKEYSYEILKSFHFNVNIDQYNKKKEWEDFILPFQYLSTTENLCEKQPGNYWDIQPLQKLDFEIDSLDIELLDSIIKSNTSNYLALDRLSQKITKNHIDKRLQKLAQYGFFRFHSQVNFLGIDFTLRLKVHINGDQIHKENIIAFFYQFPEVMIFSNDDFIIIYIRIPRNFISELVENIYLFNLIFKNDKKSIFLYSSDYYSIKNSIYVLDKITYKNGIANKKL